jgi:hypothetical protein
MAEDENMYHIQLTLSCSNEQAYQNIRKALTDVLNSLSVKYEDSSEDNNIDIFWEGPMNHLAKLRSRLQKVAKQYSCCFEVILETNESKPETYFIGVNADVRESDYLLKQLNIIVPRLLKRYELIAEKCQISAAELKENLTFLSSIKEINKAEGEEGKE